MMIGARKFAFFGCFEKLKQVRKQEVILFNWVSDLEKSSEVLSVEWYRIARSGNQ